MRCLMVLLVVLCCALVTFGEDIFLMPSEVQTVSSEGGKKSFVAKGEVGGYFPAGVDANDSFGWTLFDHACGDALAKMASFFYEDVGRCSLTNDSGVTVDKLDCYSRCRFNHFSVLDSGERPSPAKNYNEVAVLIGYTTAPKPSPLSLGEWLDEMDLATFMGGHYFVDKNGEAWLVGAASAEQLETAKLEQKALDYAMMVNCCEVSSMISFREKNNPKRHKQSTTHDSNQILQYMKLDAAEIPGGENAVSRWYRRTTRSVSTGRKMKMVIFAVREKDLPALIRSCYSK